MPHTLDSPCYPLKQRREEWGHLRVGGGWLGEDMTYDAGVGSSGPGASLLGSSGKASKVCSMLFPRCIHRRLCRVLFHEFHTTRPHLREFLNTLQIDPITARVIADPKPSSPGRSRSKRDSRKTKTLDAFQIDPITARAIIDPKLSSPGRSQSRGNSRKTKTLDAFQIDPITARAIIDPKVSSPGRSQSKSYSRKTKTLDAFQIDPIAARAIIDPKLSSPGRLQSKSNNRKTKILDAFQIDPITARVIIDPELSSPRRSQSKSYSRKTKTLRTGKQRKHRTERFFVPDKLSSRLWLYSRCVRCPRTVGGAARVLNGRLSSPSAPTEREAHLGASENAGGSSCPFHAVIFHIFPAQSGPSDYGGNTSHLPSPLPYSCGVDGVIHPRTGGNPFLEGEVLFVATDNIPQPI
jgi:hypothetical protein